ncbi:hypothetical protein GP486_005337, partial [Trichoglossum hirsutum]
DFILFEIPISPCRTFRGREDVLSRMESYFYKLSPESRRQRSFALCGLGGSGKTQIALQFAFRNRSRYRSGVIFLNASSCAALDADFSRIFDLLELGGACDKVDSVKRWLSKEENSSWLLIFDNADDLDSVKISKYFPATSWGHIIITSRDQAAIGSVGMDGDVLEPLKVDEAVAVLIEKAGIREPSTEDYQQAQAIVELLGCLPLAVDQGGAFIRSRHKTLKDYYRLYEEHRHEVLQVKPKLGDYDKTVITAWEINFEQVERDSREASDILLLFCFLDASSISETMLYRGCSPQKRWNRQGELTEVAATDVGLDSGLVALIRNEMDFDAAIEKLLSFSLIHRSNDVNGARSFSLHPLVQHCASRRVSSEIQKKWRMQAILLVCHAFPRDEYLDPLLLPHVSRILKEYDDIACDIPMSAPVRSEIASTLLAASHFSDTLWKCEAINRVKGLLHDDTDCYMHAWATLRESSILRLLGKPIESNQTLASFIHSTVSPGHDKGLENDARWNAQRGQLVVSFADNLTQNTKFTLARQELCEWEPVDPTSPSSMERIVLRSRNITLGKILRYKGHFQKALAYLEGVLHESQRDKFYEGSGWRHVLLSNIADLLCELDRPADVEGLLNPELRNMADEGYRKSSGRCLQLSLIESFMKRGMYAEAEERLLNLKRVYETIPNQDIFAKGGIFRMWATLARISHLRSRWDEALSFWTQSLRTLEIVGRGEGPNSGIVRYCISYTHFKLGNLRESSETLEEAKKILDGTKRIFWVVGFNSYWRDFIIQSVNESMSV